MANRGKEFEKRFKEQWLETVPDSFIYRLYDVTSGYLGQHNVGDFICYKYPYIYVIDAKSIQGNTLPFSDLRQYDQMLEYKDITGLKIGFIVWFVDHDRVLWIPVQTMEKIKLEGRKSFNIRTMDRDKYPYLEIPSKKLRTFMKSDYSFLTVYYDSFDDLKHQDRLVKTDEGWAWKLK